MPKLYGGRLPIRQVVEAENACVISVTLNKLKMLKFRLVLLRNFISTGELSNL